MLSGPDNIRVHGMPRQCISKRNKNIKEREKNIQFGNIFTKICNIVQIIFLLWPMHDRQKI